MDFMVHTGNAKCETGISGSKKTSERMSQARLDIDWRVRNAVAKWKRVDR